MRTESGCLTDMADVAFCVVLCGRCPSADDLRHGMQGVLVCIGAQEAEGGPDAPLHGTELNEVRVGLLVALSFPMGLR